MQVHDEWRETVIEARECGLWVLESPLNGASSRVLLERLEVRFEDVVVESRSQTVERVSSSGVRPSWVMETLR